MSSLMLICAVAVSLALGVLIAHGLCVVMFRAFKIQSIAAAERRAEKAEKAAAVAATSGMQVLEG